MQALPWHRTKIVCTLGPATDPPEVIERMLRAGMDVARVNMSHGSRDDSARRIAAVRATAERLGQPVAVLADLPGPKFRLGDIPGGTQRLEEGSTVTLALDAAGPARLPVRNPELLRALRNGETVFLADGAVELRVRDARGDRAECEVVIGGAVRSGSGLNVPDSELGALVPTDADRELIAFAQGEGVEWLGISFVQSAEDIARVRSACAPSRPPLLMAKIEKRRALADLEAIVEAADGVMVARGDLGVETDLAAIALVQKRIIAVANARARPVVTATQMLESMIEHEHPTRAEVTDVANAVLDGTDAVMLSGETAIGRHPVAAVAILDRVLRATEAESAAALRRDARASGDAIGSAAARLASQIQARAVIVAVDAFATAAALAGTQSSVPLVAICADERLARSLAVVRGVAPIAAVDPADANAAVALARAWLFARGLARPGDRALLLLASGARTGELDTLQAVTLT